MMEHQEELDHDENPLVEDDILSENNPPPPATAHEDHQDKSEEELDPDATSTTTTTQTKKKKIPSRKVKSRKKRHREEEGPSTKAERVLVLKMDRYSKLSYQAQKELLKQAKLVRTFLVQKQIRKLKQKNTDDGKTDMTTSSSSTSSTSSSLQLLKDLNLDLVVQQAFKQLGVGHANPDPEADFSKINTPLPMDTTTKSWIATILDHKRFQTALEDWNERVAEFRRFCLQLDDQQNGRFSSSENPGSKKKKGSGKTKPTSLRGQSSQQESSQQPISYFCTSLNDDDVDVELEGGPMSAYGPAATTGGMMDDPTFVVKKNRRGQRARKAKALAIQAKKEGKQYQSINWREEKPKTTTRKSSRKAKTSSSSGEEQRSQRPTRTTVAPSVPAPSVEDLSQNHPSWAAKQQQKPTIVAFQGKKITFD